MPGRQRTVPSKPVRSLRVDDSDFDKLPQCGMTMALSKRRFCTTDGHRSIHLGNVGYRPTSLTSVKR